MMKQLLEEKLTTYEEMLAVAVEKNLPQQEMMKGKVLMLKELMADIATANEIHA